MRGVNDLLSAVDARSAPLAEPKKESVLWRTPFFGRVEHTLLEMLNGLLEDYEEAVAAINQSLQIKLRPSDQC